MNIAKKHFARRLVVLYVIFCSLKWNQISVSSTFLSIFVVFSLWTRKLLKIRQILNLWNCWCIYKLCAKVMILLPDIGQPEFSSVMRDFSIITLSEWSGAYGLKMTYFHPFSVVAQNTSEIHLISKICNPSKNCCLKTKRKIRTLRVNLSLFDVFRHIISILSRPLFLAGSYPSTLISPHFVYLLWGNTSTSKNILGLDNLRFATKMLSDHSSKGIWLDPHWNFEHTFISGHIQQKIKKGHFLLGRFNVAFQNKPRSFWLIPADFRPIIDINRSAGNQNFPKHFCVLESWGSQLSNAPWISFISCFLRFLVTMVSSKRNPEISYQKSTQTLIKNGAKLISEMIFQYLTEMSFLTDSRCKTHLHTHSYVNRKFLWSSDLLGPQKFRNVPSTAIFSEFCVDEKKYFALTLARAFKRCDTTTELFAFTAWVSDESLTKTKVETASTIFLISLCAFKSLDNKVWTLSSLSWDKFLSSYHLVLSLGENVRFGCIWGFQTGQKCDRHLPTQFLSQNMQYPIIRNNVYPE